MFNTQSIARPAAPSSSRVFVAQTLALYRKDLRAELRTKTAVSSVGLFTLCALMLLALATTTLKDVEVTNANGVTLHAWDSPSRFAMLWVLLCFAAFAGLAHAFVHEEQAGTTMALRLAMRAHAVYAAKLLVNFTLVLAIALLATPLYMLATGLIVGRPVVFVLTMLSGCIGLAASATIVAAIAAKSKGAGALYGALGLPMLLIFIVLLMNAARTIYIVDVPALRVVKDVGGLLSFGVFLITLSALTFPYVWED